MASSYKKVSTGQIKGWVEKEILQLLPPHFFEHPVRVIQELNGKVIKESRLRWAAIFCLADQKRIFLKRDRTKGWFESLKYLILPSKARKEWFIADQLHRRNLAVPRPLGWMEKVHQGMVQESYYLSEAVGSGISFIEDCSKSRDPLIGELAKMVKKVHKAGLFHGDLHAGNFLWDGNRFYLADLHSAKITRGLSLSQRLWNLAHLFHSLRSAWGEKEHSKFIDVYFEGESLDPRKKEKALQKINSWMDRLQRRQWRSRTKRCLKESTEFSIQRMKGTSYYLRRDFPLDFLIETVQEHLQSPLREPLALVKNSAKLSVSIVETKGRRISTKHYHPITLWDRFRENFRRSKGMRAWIAGNGLRAREVRSVKPLGLVERRDWLGLMESFFVMEALEGNQELDRYIIQSLEDFRMRRHFIKSFAQWLSQFHKKSLHHRDMKTCNILVGRDGEGWGFYPLDLEDVRLDEEVGEKEVFGSFLQLNTSTPKMVTTTDRFRFLRAYLRLNPVVKDRKSFLRRLIHESKRREVVYVAPWGVVTERL